MNPGFISQVPHVQHYHFGKGGMIRSTSRPSRQKDVMTDRSRSSGGVAIQKPRSFRVSDWRSASPLPTSR
jgi:hypothetical protein